jgi:hypothetical protein
MRRLATSGVYSVKDFDLLPIVYVKSLLLPCATTTTTTTIRRTLPASLGVCGNTNAPLNESYHRRKQVLLLV